MLIILVYVEKVPSGTLFNIDYMDYLFQFRNRRCQLFDFIGGIEEERFIEHRILSIGIQRYRDNICLNQIVKKVSSKRYFRS